MMKRLLVLLSISLFAVLLSLGFISAAVCKYDGKWYSCNNKYSPVNPFKKTSMSFWEKKYPHHPDYIQSYDYSHDYNHTKYHSYSKDYYKVNYELDYSTSYDAGYYGYDKFMYYDNGYEHEYKYGQYGYENTNVKLQYEEVSKNYEHVSSREKTYSKDYLYKEYDYVKVG